MLPTNNEDEEIHGGYNPSPISATQHTPPRAKNQLLSSPTPTPIAKINNCKKADFIQINVKALTTQLGKTNPASCRRLCNYKTRV
jgi:hypothetical protein